MEEQFGASCADADWRDGLVVRAVARRLKDRISSPYTQVEIGEPGGQPERRAARFSFSMVSGRRPVTLAVRWLEL